MIWLGLDAVPALPSPQIEEQKVADQSHLDKRYFVDETVYNCPFCNRRHVPYSVCAVNIFDWTNTKRCYSYLVCCHSCSKKSMHLAFREVPVQRLSSAHQGNRQWRFNLAPGIDAGEFLDSAFFYSVPTSFFAIDDRIPRILRELLTEAQGCLKSNFLTGASACARKIVYELAILRNADGQNYEDRIKSLKGKHPDVAPEFFDTLITVQELTSAKVHENSFDGWSADHLRIILAALSEVLHEIYVLPALRKDRQQDILRLKAEIMSSADASQARDKENG